MSVTEQAREYWNRFWRLPWRWKAPALAVAAFVLVAAVTPSADEPAPSPPEGSQEVVAAATELETATTTTEATLPPTEEPAAETLEATGTAVPAESPERMPEPTLTLEPTRTPEATPPPTPSPTDSPSTPTSDDAGDVIAGLTAADVTLKLEEQGLACDGPAQQNGVIRWLCTGTGSAGELLRVEVVGESPTRIVAVYGALIGGTDAQAALILGFLATLPYDGADPPASQAWVKANVAAGGEQVVGGARFTLGGPVGGRFLDITALNR